MISKELLSEVLKIEIIEILGIDKKNDLVYRIMQEYRCESGYESKPVGTFINIYELAHKCKEWAFSLGCELSSFKANYSGSWFSTIKFVDVMARPISFNSNKEPEAIFKACEWLLDNKES